MWKPAVLTRMHTHPIEFSLLFWYINIREYYQLYSINEDRINRIIMEDSLLSASSPVVG